MGDVNVGCEDKVLTLARVDEAEWEVCPPLLTGLKKAGCEVKVLTLEGVEKAA